MSSYNIGGNRSFIKLFQDALYLNLDHFYFLSLFQIVLSLSSFCGSFSIYHSTTCFLCSPWKVRMTLFLMQWGVAPVLPPVVEPLQVNTIALDRAPIIGILEGMAARQPLLSRPKLPCWRKFQEFFRRIVRSTIFRDYFDMVSSTRGLASVVGNFYRSTQWFFSPPSPPFSSQFRCCSSWRTSTRSSLWRRPSVSSLREVWRKFQEFFRQFLWSSFINGLCASSNIAFKFIMDDDAVKISVGGAPSGLGSVAIVEPLQVLGAIESAVNAISRILGLLPLLLSSLCLATKSKANIIYSSGGGCCCGSSGSSCCGACRFIHNYNLQLNVHRHHLNRRVSTDSRIQVVSRIFLC